MHTTHLARSLRPQHRLFSGLATFLGTLVLLSSAAHAQGVRLFTDGSGVNYWDYSYGTATGTSAVEVVNGSKIPVEFGIRWRGTSGVRVRWTSQPGGDWLIGIATGGWAPFDATPLDSLVFWAYSPSAIPAADLPLMFLEDQNNTRTPRYSMSAANPGGLPAGAWTKLAMPLAPFKSGPGAANLTKLNKAFWAQNPTGTTGVQRLMYADEPRFVRTDPTPPAPPSVSQVLGFPRHVDLVWSTPVPSDVESYRVEKLVNGTWVAQKGAPAEDGGTSLWLGAPALACTLRAVAEDWSFRESAPSASQTSFTAQLPDDEFLDMIQRASFRYFWDSAHPVSGLIRERTTSGDVCATGGTGFGLMCMPVGVERGYVTRAQAAARVLQILTFLSTTAERHFGAFPHWIHGVTGQHVPFLGSSDDTVDLVETSFLAEGMLTVRQYFDGASADEVQIRALATQLWQGIDFPQFLPPISYTLRWHRSPTTGLSSATIAGWNEAMIVYLLGIASPTHPLPVDTYARGWARNGNFVNPNSFYGYRLYVGSDYGGPMFFAHYSFLGLDPRFKKDAYANYYTHNRNHALVQVAYAVANPAGRTGYNANTWGLTASDDPFGYSAHAAFSNDNGTITPTAALASMPYVPQQSMAAARNFYDTYGATLWGFRGFKDAFHPGLGWTDTEEIAIDQGPIVVMIENYRSGLLWNRFMSNPEVVAALAAVGFVADSAAVTGVPGGGPPRALRLAASPNPSLGDVVLALDAPAAGRADVEVFDLSGRRVAVLARGPLAAGAHRFAWNGRDESGRPVAPGVYLARAQVGGEVVRTRIVRVR